MSRIIIENQELIKKKKVLLRNINIPDIGSINVLTGIRRCGKTYVLYENAKKYNQDRVLFIDFEDERLVRLNLLDNYDIILDSYKKIYPDKKPIIFFDEVQNLKNWHLYIKRLHVAGYKIFVTGSNAYLLSKDIATFLKGRSIETNIHPFSFKEFLKVKSKDFKNRDFYVKVPEILNLFDEYLVYGAFPEVINANIYDKRKVIKNIYRKEEIYFDPYIDQAPDLVLIGNRGFNLKAALATNKIADRGIFTGKHSQSDGFLLINRKITKDNPDVFEVVPLIEKFMDDG